MTKKFEIILKYIQDLSVEIPSPDIYLFSREYITKYSLGINITTKPMKNEMIEIITKLHYKDPSDNKRKSYFEIAYATVIKIKDKNLIKEDLEKIILIEVQKEIYTELEKICEIKGPLKYSLIMYNDTEILLNEGLGYQLRNLV